MNTYGLKERSYNELLSILASTPEVEEAVLYGSRARGDFGVGSDIDLSLRGEGLTMQTLSLLNRKFYESHIPYFIDIHDYKRIKNPEFKANVDRDGIAIFTR